MKLLIQNLVEEFQKMDFSARFIEEAAQSPGSSGAYVWRSYVNAFVRPSEEDKKKIGQICTFSHTWIYYDILDKKYKKSFRESGTELIYKAETFAIYRECRGSKIAFVLVCDKNIYSRFEYEDFSPLILQHRINANFKTFELLFLGFPTKKETIVVLSTGKPAFFFGVPFIISSFLEDGRATLSCGVRTKISLERIETDKPVLVFSF